MNKLKENIMNAEIKSGSRNTSNTSNFASTCVPTSVSGAAASATTRSNDT